MKNIMMWQLFLNSYFVFSCQPQFVPQVPKAFPLGPVGIASVFQKGCRAIAKVAFRDIFLLLWEEKESRQRTLGTRLPLPLILSIKDSQQLVSCSFKVQSSHRVKPHLYLNVIKQIIDFSSNSKQTKEIGKAFLGSRIEELSGRHLITKGPEGSEYLKLGEEMSGSNRISKQKGAMAKFSAGIMIRGQRAMDVCHLYSSRTFG